MQLVVLAAMPEEADPLWGHRGRTDRVAGMAVRHVTVEPPAGRDPHRVAVAVCGPGKVNASAAAAALGTHLEADALLMSGVCGLLRPHDADTFWLAEAVQHDYGAARAVGFAHFTAGTLPLGTPDLVPHAAMPDPGLDLPHVRVASGDSFVEDPARAEAFVDDLYATVVDMETGAMAQVAASLGVPWAAVKAVTDTADDAGAGDFEANLAAAAARAAAAVERLVDLL